MAIETDNEGIVPPGRDADVFSLLRCFPEEVRQQNQSLLRSSRGRGHPSRWTFYLLGQHPPATNPEFPTIKAGGRQSRFTQDDDALWPRPTNWWIKHGPKPLPILSNTLLPKDIRSHRAVPHGHSKPGLHTPWRLDLSTSLHVSAHPARMSNVVVAQRLRTVKTAIPIWTSSYIKSRDDGILAPPQDDLSAGTSRPPQKNQIDDQQSLE
jgi:hypothetical protein